MTPQVVESAPSGTKVRELTVCLAGTAVPVVSDVSLSIPEGEVVALVGESGSGKTTVGLAVLGYARRGLEITSGSVEVGSLDVLALDPSKLEHARGRVVSYVPQDPATSLNPAHRVGQQLRETLEIHQSELSDTESAERVDRLLDEVGLTATILKSFPHQMSGGQQQRIAIAIAFACRPRVVVLDEPTTGLDVTTQGRILDMVRDLAQSYGVSGLYISHDLPAVGQIATSTAVMYAGRIVEQSDTKRVFAAPRHPYTAALLAAAPSAKYARKVVGIEGHPPRPGRRPKGCSFADRCPRADEESRAAVPPLREIAPGHLVACAHPLLTEGLRALKGGPSPSPRPVPSQLGLQVRGLTAHYGGAPVVEDVSFDIEPGLCTAIVGESGSGKSTIGRCLVGLHQRWTGEIRLGATPLTRAGAGRTPEQRRLMQYIFQNPFASLDPTMTVLENIEEPVRHFERLSRRERHRKVLEVLNVVALSDDFADRLPSQLSGGERQRVAVGRALVVNPEILICDEITSALDVSIQALLIEQLRALQLEQSLSMVFITHNLAVVRSLAQHVVVLEHGRVVERGSVADVLDQPRHAYTRQLMSDLPHILEHEEVAAPG